MTEPRRPDDVVTALPDLADLDLADLLDPAMAKMLAPFVEAVVAQVERPRINLGGSGPPGRVD